MYMNFFFKYVLGDEIKGRDKITGFDGIHHWLSELSEVQAECFVSRASLVQRKSQVANCSKVKRVEERRESLS